jgi:hypothetical protein
MVDHDGINVAQGPSLDTANFSGSCGVAAIVA